MPYFRLSEIAVRLNVKEYWLQSRLIQDQRSPEPRLQFHHYLGTTRLWTHDALDALREAMADELATKRRSPGSGRTRRADRDERDDRPH